MVKKLLVSSFFMIGLIGTIYPKEKENTNFLITAFHLKRYLLEILWKIEKMFLVKFLLSQKH